MYHVPLALQSSDERGETGMGRRVVRFQEEGREWRLPDLLYADDLVLCGESEKDLREMVGNFAKMCRRRRGLKVNAGKSKVMVLDGKEGLKYEVCVDIHLEQVSKFKYLGCFGQIRYR